MSDTRLSRDVFTHGFSSLAKRIWSVNDKNGLSIGVSLLIHSINAYDFLLIGTIPTLENNMVKIQGIISEKYK